MQLRVLGPIEASVDGRSLNLGGTKQRAVLAMLCLEANHVVSADRLIDGLWGERPPTSAAKMIQNYVWRLRGILGEEAGAEIVTRGRGYELRVDEDAVDVRRFERLMTEAWRARQDAMPPAAAREALALWRGEPLTDLADEPFAAAEIRRLEEARLEAIELVIDADLVAGGHLKVAGEIDALIDAHPLRERLHAQRMLALYRCGRQADALEAYRAARRTLVEQIGVEPGPQLRRLQAAILRQDHSLELAVSTPALPHELDTAGAPPLVGRARELAALRAGWSQARGGQGTLLNLIGGHGTGKTRVVAELAAEAHQDGAAVMYATGAGAPSVALAAVAEARETTRPALLVADDADRGSAELREAIAALATELLGRPVLVVGTGQEAAALARLDPSASIALPPLDAEAVREIALLYAPAGSEAEVPVDALLAESRGVARLVHTAASRWARREAARRVDAVADRAAAGRAHARALEAELAGSVVALQSTQERAARLAARDGDDVACPFMGLAGFEAGDAQYFFGREQLVAELLARLAGAPLLAIVGPSGSGKSSVLRAGLLPALAGGVLPRSEAWAQVLIRPGEQPMRELRRATAGLGAERRMLLAVDQFEEVFTSCADEHERDVFVTALVQAARDERGVVVLALRADFYQRCAAQPELARLLAAGHLLVPPMTRDEMRRAITRPAERVGVQVDPDLEAAIVGDLEGQPGALPLLSTALLELWSRRDGRRLQLAAYSRSGGVHGAVARLAENAFRRLDAAQQEIARTLLLRLADEAEDGAIVRRRVALADLDHVTTPVLDVLTGQRLLTISAGTVEVAHEALLREWPRLRAWLEDDAEGRRLHRRLDRAARDWAHGGRDRSELYRGAPLALAVEWRSDHAPELNAVEREFLDASRAASDRARRRARLAFGGVLALLAVTLVAALLAFDGRDRARAQARAAEAQRLGVQALSEPALDRSLLLARQGVALDDTPAARDNLLAALRRSPAAIAVMRGDGDGLTAVALQPDGRTIATADSNGTVAFLDARSGRRLGPLHQSAAIASIDSLAFSPDGDRLASAGSDANGGLIELFDGRSRRSIRLLNASDDPWRTFRGVTFSPDSGVLAAQTIADDDVSPEPNRLARWDARTGRQVGYVRPIPGRSSTFLGYLTTARLVTSSVDDHATTIRDGVSLRAVRSYPVAAPVAALSPSVGLVAFGSRDGSVRVLDLASGRVRTAVERHEGPVTAMAFGPDGTRLVTMGRDERLIVWDSRRAAAVESLQARGRGLPADVAVTRDGRTAYSALGDGTLVVWDLDGARRLDRPLDGAGRPLAPRSLAVAVDGSRFTTIDAGDSVDIYDSRTLRLTSRIPFRGGRPGGATLAPDGRTVAAINAAGDLGFWDAATGRPLAALQSAHADAASWLAFSRDGRWLVTGGGGNILRSWDADRRAPVGTLPRRVADVSFGPDSAMVAVTLEEENFNGGLELLSVPGLELIRTVRVPPGTLGRFSRDGRSFIYGDRQGRLWTLDPRTWEPRGRPLSVSGPLVGADVSPDGRVLVTTSVDGTARLWNATSGRAIGGPITDASGDIVGAAFIGDGSRALVVHTHGGSAWLVRPSSWERHACTVAGRRLTPAEWEAALPERDYAPAC